MIGRPDAAADDPLFTYLPSRGKPNQPLHPRVVWLVVKRYAKRAGMAHISPRILRNTVATRLVQNPKVDLATAAAVLGHRSLETTARYGQPSDDDLAAAVEELE